MDDDAVMCAVVDALIDRYRRAVARVNAGRRAPRQPCERLWQCVHFGVSL
ncbi:MAG: hypothetical protein RRY12_13175 [Cloacibacillus sp.]